MGPSPWMQVLTPQRIEQISSFPHTQMMVSPLHERRCRVHESCCLHQFLSAVPYYRRILLGFIFSTQWLLVCGFLPEVYQFNHWTPREFYLSEVDDWVTPDLFSHAQFEDSPERINLSVGPQTGSSLIDIYHGLATNSPKDHPERSVQHQSESKGEQRGRYKERVASVIAGYPSDLDHDNRRDGLLSDVVQPPQAKRPAFEHTAPDMFKPSESLTGYDNNQHAHPNAPAWRVALGSLEAFLQADEPEHLYPEPLGIVHAPWSSLDPESQLNKDVTQVEDEVNSPRKLLDHLDPAMFDDEPPVGNLHRTPDPIWPQSAALYPSPHHQNGPLELDEGFILSSSTSLNPLNQRPSLAIENTAKRFDRAETLYAPHLHEEPLIQRGDSYLNRIVLESNHRGSHLPAYAGLPVNPKNHYSPQISSSNKVNVGLPTESVILEYPPYELWKGIITQEPSHSSSSTIETQYQNRFIRQRSPTSKTSLAEAHHTRTVQPQTDLRTGSENLSNLIDPAHPNLDTHVSSSPNEDQILDSHPVDLIRDLHSFRPGEGETKKPESSSSNEDTRYKIPPYFVRARWPTHWKKRKYDISKPISADRLKRLPDRDLLETSESVQEKPRTEVIDEFPKRKKHRKSDSFGKVVDEDVEEHERKSNFLQKPEQSLMLSRYIQEFNKKSDADSDRMKLADALPHLTARIMGDKMVSKALSFIEPHFSPYMKALQDFISEYKIEEYQGEKRRVQIEFILGRIESLTYEFLVMQVNLAKVYETELNDRVMEKILTSGYDWMLSVWEESPMNRIRQLRRGANSFMDDILEGKSLGVATSRYLEWQNATKRPRIFITHLIIEWMYSKKPDWVAQLKAIPTERRKAWGTSGTPNPDCIDILLVQMATKYYANRY